MLRFAVCDDDTMQLEELQRLLCDYFQSRPDEPVQIEAFHSGEALLERADTIGGFDLYILDILMPGADGIQTGRKLRLLENPGEIIFLSNSNDFAADSYDVRAFFYLLKPVEKTRFFLILDEAIEKRRLGQSKGIIISTTNGPRHILFEHILYAERMGRRIRYYCTDGVIDSQTIRLPFRDMISSLLSDRRFYLCGASFVLNFQHVTGVNKQTALLDNGQSVALPRSSAASFKKAWGGYWLEETK